jgi:hypothetical protein
MVVLVEKYKFRFYRSIKLIIEIMKKITIYAAFLLLIMIAASSCRKSFDELGADANRPTNVPPSLLLNGVLNDLYDAPFGDYEKWSQYFLQNYDYYGNNRYDFGEGKNYYNTLKNVVKMEEEAKNIQLPDVNCYSALAKFLKAYFFTKMSLEMGDIPMTDALKGLTNLTPAYDTQKAVFKQAFDWLESANTDLTALQKSANTLQGDIYLDNDLAKWQKTVNTFRLRLLLHLSKRADDADLQIKQQFNDIITNPAKYPIMGSSSDNLAYKYIYPTNKYPKNPGSFGFDALRENCSDTYEGLLTSFKDPRVYVTCEPAPALFKAANPTDMAAFIGANPGEDLGIMYAKANAGQYSLLNRYHYYRTFLAESCIQIGYPELCFNIAEGINRGWAPSLTAVDAENQYKKGITASMAFYGIPSTGTMPVYFFKQGFSIDATDAFNTYNVDVDFEAYYNQGLVKYSGNNATGLTQILQQRYLALFSHSGLESYFTFRRTGVPVFGTGPGTGNSARIAMRFQYPTNEITTNATNYQAALTSQFGGNDDINGVMWILK